MFSDTKKKADAGRAQTTEPSLRPKRRSLAQILASYGANAGRLRRRILRILNPRPSPIRAQDSV